MKAGLRIGLIGLMLMGMFAFVPGVSAHPLGNFTINHYLGVQIERGSLSLEFILDMAEIPALQEISQMDRNRNGKVDPGEDAGYAQASCAALSDQLLIRRNQNRVALALQQALVSYPPGAGGLATLRLTCLFENSAMSFQPDDRLEIADQSYPDRLGWREIVISAQDIPLSGQFASQSVSQKLTAYPQDLLSSPLDVRQAAFRVGAAGQPASHGDPAPEKPKTTSAWTAGARSDRFTDLITLQDFSPLAVIAALLIAFVWGGLHSLTPGHGKTIVAAYLVGSRGTGKHALYLGLLTTLTHTAGVFLLGLVTLFASRYVVPEQLFPWISLASGILVVTIGLALFAGRLRATTVWRAWAGRLPGRQILRRDAPAQATLRGSLRISAVPVGGRRAPASQAVLWTGGQAHPHEHAHGGEHAHGHPHSHLPPETPAGNVTWRSLLALGVSGGLLPCPSALVVLLGAIALDRIGFGILLVFVFSLGLASVLTGIGLLLVYARRIFDHLPVHSRLVELIPTGSALFISILGAGLTLQALSQLGWIGR